MDCEKNWKEQVKNARDVTAIQKAICIFTVSQAEDLGGRLIGQLSLFYNCDSVLFRSEFERCFEHI